MIAKLTKLAKISTRHSFVVIGVFVLIVSDCRGSTRP